VGIVDDPLLHARLFSYLDTQLTRLGGPNFAQIPINRPFARVNDNNRDGFAQQAVHEGVAPYAPNSLGAGCPFAAPGDGVYAHPPLDVAGQKMKLRPASFDDHYSQAAMFYRSLTDVEREHIVAAFSFELGKCISPQIQARMLENLGRVDSDLTEQVAAHLGLDVPTTKAAEPSFTSPALSMVLAQPAPPRGRIVAVLAGDGTTKAAVSTWRDAADALGVEIVVIGPRFGKLGRGVIVDRSVHVTDPVEYDGIVLAAPPDETFALFVQEAYRHHKAIAIADDKAVAALGLDGVACEPTGFFDVLALHRDWDR
jgi:catalase